MVGVDTRECSLHHDLRPISDSGRSVEIKCSTRLDGLSRWPRRVVFPSAGVPEAISRPHLLDGVITPYLSGLPAMLAQVVRGAICAHNYGFCAIVGLENPSGLEVAVIIMKS